MYKKKIMHPVLKGFTYFIKINALKKYSSNFTYNSELLHMVCEND